MTIEAEGEISTGNVVSLLPFIIPKEKLSIHEKLQWLKLHPIQPTCPRPPFDSSRLYFRQIKTLDNTTEMIPRKWLSFCFEDKKVYCSVCAVFAETRDSVFCKGKISNRKNVYEKVEKHELSVSHKNATNAFLVNSKKINVEQLLITKYESVVQHNRDIVQRVINTIILLAK